MTNPPLDGTFSMRINEGSLELFKDHCKSVLKRDYSDVLREVVNAVPDNRVTITQTEEQIAARESLYK